MIKAEWIKYGLTALITFFVVKGIDIATDQTDELIQEKQHLIDNLNELRIEWQLSEVKRKHLQEQNKLKDIIILQHETDHDSLIYKINHANDVNDFHVIDSIGAELINELRGRR